MTPAAFRSTRWTLVQRAQGHDAGSQAALSELCEIYYQPVLSFIEHRIGNPDSARDLAHAFFEDLISRKGLGSPDPEQGRFRSYLLGAVKHFLAKHREKARAAKRGGGCKHTDADLDQVLSTDDDDLRFDRDWAHALIIRAHSALEAEMAAASKQHSFEVLCPFLDGGPQPSREDACRSLKLTPNALNVAIHRLREQFRSHIRAEVAATTSEPNELQDEFRHLLAVLTRNPRT